MTNYTIIAVEGRFYFFGEEVEAPEGYYKLRNAAMFGGYSGGKGLPGVYRGDPESEVTLDRFGEDKEICFPIGNVLAIFNGCIDLYNFRGTTLR